MGLRFRRETDYHQHLAENPGRMAELAGQLVAQNGVLLSERNSQAVGMIGFVVYPHFLSGEVVAGEVFWWVEPEYRGEGVKLLREAEKRVKQAGAHRMQMIAPNDALASLYRRLGYGFIEAAYQKTL